MSLTRRALHSSRTAIYSLCARSVAAVAATPAAVAVLRTFSTTPAAPSHNGSNSAVVPPAAATANIPDGDAFDVPRWAQTPPRMKAPFSLQQPKDPRRSYWRVNEDPAKLDRVCERVLGRELTRALPPELKWLAVTHKSFDNGRRGFNTRLAFFGRMVVALETTKLIMAAPMSPTVEPDEFGRTPFSHPMLANVDKLHRVQPHALVAPDKVADLARELGLLDVVRWKPRLPQNLAASGVDVVLTSTVFALVGTVSLHFGADVASQMVRERLLERLAERLED